MPGGRPACMCRTSASTGSWTSSSPRARCSRGSRSSTLRAWSRAPRRCRPTPQNPDARGASACNWTTRRQGAGLGNAFLSHIRCGARKSPRRAKADGRASCGACARMRTGVVLRLCARAPARARAHVCGPQRACPQRVENATDRSGPTPGHAAPCAAVTRSAGASREHGAVRCGVRCGGLGEGVGLGGWLCV